MTERPEVVLIGPRGNGKSTVAGMLAHSLGMGHAAFDRDRWRFYAEMGYDAAVAEGFLRRGDLERVFDYWGPFETHALERFLEEHRHAVLDLGAGHTVFGREDLFRRVERALAPFANLVLLLPSADRATSMRVLSERADDADRRRPYIAAWLDDPRRHRLAKHTVFEEGRSPEELAEEILSILPGPR